jgi:RNA polymerase sigma-70 factor (ECF subfamily)
MTTNAGAVAEVDESTLLPALRAGDERAFQRLTDRYRRELLVHCYRMLGSFHDAEDVLQETLLRAWRGLETFEGRSALRPWLYKIATNACLDVLASRRRRALPNATHPAAAQGDPFPGPVMEPLWIEPMPDTLIDLRPAVNPEAHYDARESVTLAFLATLQTLPGRQRATLILRDVLGWKATEVAELLGTSVAAVTSALQRARVSMKSYQAGSRNSDASSADTEETAALLSRYVNAWQAADATGLVALLREDALITMPPLPLWFQGRSAIQWFFETQLFTGEARGRFRLVATQANGSPAFATYQRDETGPYRLGALQVLTIGAARISAIHDFLAMGSQPFPGFDLPLALTD